MKCTSLTCDSKTVVSSVSMSVVFEAPVHCSVFISDVHYGQSVGSVPNNGDP